MIAQIIRSHAESVSIPYLLHFTRAVNLPSIMLHGIYPVGRVHEINVRPAINDQCRFDGHQDSTSVSIGFPNCQMLYKYRKADEGVEWSILVLHPSILWGKSCAFCLHNAADGRISSQSVANLMRPEAFIGMYGEVDGMPTRAEQNLKTYDPTDVQAEVLVFDVIEPQYILGVIFESKAVQEIYLDCIGNRRTYVHANNKGMFANRRYARTWGN